MISFQLYLSNIDRNNVEMHSINEGLFSAIFSKNSSRSSNKTGGFLSMFFGQCGFGQSEAQRARNEILIQNREKAKKRRDEIIVQLDKMRAAKIKAKNSVKQAELESKHKAKMEELRAMEAKYKNVENTYKNWAKNNPGRVISHSEVQTMMAEMDSWTSELETNMQDEAKVFQNAILMAVVDKDGNPRTMEDAIAEINSNKTLKSAITNYMKECDKITDSMSEEEIANAIKNELGGTLDDIATKESQRQEAENIKKEAQQKEQQAQASITAADKVVNDRKKYVKEQAEHIESKIINGEDVDTTDLSDDIKKVLQDRKIINNEGEINSYKESIEQRQKAAWDEFVETVNEGESAEEVEVKWKDFCKKKKDNDPDSVEYLPKKLPDTYTGQQIKDNQNIGDIFPKPESVVDKIKSNKSVTAEPSKPTIPDNISDNEKEFFKNIIEGNTTAEEVQKFKSLKETEKSEAEKQITDQQKIIDKHHAEEQELSERRATAAESVQTAELNKALSDVEADELLDDLQPGESVGTDGKVYVQDPLDPDSQIPKPAHNADSSEIEAYENARKLNVISSNDKQDLNDKNNKNLHLKIDGDKVTFYPEDSSEPVTKNISDLTSEEKKRIVTIKANRNNVARNKAAKEVILKNDQDKAFHKYLDDNEKKIRDRKLDSRIEELGILDTEGDGEDPEDNNLDSFKLGKDEYEVKDNTYYKNGKEIEKDKFEEAQDRYSETDDSEDDVSANDKEDADGKPKSPKRKIKKVPSKIKGRSKYVVYNSDGKRQKTSDGKDVTVSKDEWLANKNAWGKYKKRLAKWENSSSHDESLSTYLSDSINTINENKKSKLCNYLYESLNK